MFFFQDACGAVVIYVGNPFRSGLIVHPMCSNKSCWSGDPLISSVFRLSLVVNNLVILNEQWSPLVRGSI